MVGYELATTVVILGVLPLILYFVAVLYRSHVSHVNMHLQYTTLPPD